jgi:hypothetical protein
VPHAALSVSSSTGKLDGEAFSHKVGSIFIVFNRTLVSSRTKGDRVLLPGKEEDKRERDVRAMTYGRLHMVRKRDWLAMIDPVAK